MKCPRCSTENAPDSGFCSACAAPLAGAKKSPPASTKTLEIPTPVSLSGTLFAGRYQVVEELGRGGMGIVYRAIDNHLREEVALKVIKPEIASDRTAVERFSGELKLARKIVHRNVCRMYELMEHQGVRFISMEYVPGEDLRSFIRRARRLDAGAAVAIAIQVCEGLAEAHRLGVVHRDLKPGNIMIDKDGNAKIMDFGIARSRTERAITGEGRVVGTPEYISPEQFEGAAADAQSDLYALGVILFEMTCGTFPFEGDTAQIIAQKIAGRRPPDPQTINPHVPNDLAKAILKCLEKRRDRRFGSANELLAELRRIESGLPTSERLMVKARSSVFTGLTRRLMKKRTLGILFGLAVCAVVAVLFTRPRGKAAPDGAAVLSVRPTLAVLFFANRTNDTELDYLRKNLCIKFISSLRQLAPDLPVRSHIDIYSQLKRLGLESGEYSADDLSEIARKLDVSHIMTGQLMKLGNIWQIYYELRDMASLALADSGQMNGKPEELDAIVAKLAENALQGLRIPVSGQVRAIGSRDPLANKLYAMARDAEINAVLSAEESEKDAQLSRMFQKLQEAIATDQAFAAAYWGLGDYYGLLYVANGRLKDLNLMKSNYERAYELDPQLAGANAGLGWARFYDEQMDDAFHCFLNALRLAPDDPEININIGSFLFSIGQIDSGIRYFTRAIEAGDESANPLGPLYRRAVSFFSIGKLAEADSDVREMIALESQDVALRILHARILAKMKRIDDANEELARIESLNPGNTDLLYVRACIRAAAGDGAEVLPLLERARKEDPLSRSYFLSENYAQLGMTDRAVEVIRDGIENGFSKVFFTLYPYQVLTNGSYERIRGDSRFMKILGERKKISDSQREKYRELCRPQPSR